MARLESSESRSKEEVPRVRGALGSPPVGRPRSLRAEAGSPPAAQRVHQGTRRRTPGPGLPPPRASLEAAPPLSLAVGGVPGEAAAPPLWQSPWTRRGRGLGGAGSQAGSALRSSGRPGSPTLLSWVGSLPGRALPEVVCPAPRVTAAALSLWRDRTRPPQGPRSVLGQQITSCAESLLFFSLIYDAMQFHQGSFHVCITFLLRLSRLNK
jgi:hypothetical protein